MLKPIIDVLHDVLRLFYGFTHDYTLSIVLLTLAIKLVLHPLTRVQLRSMKAMQVLAPHMEALKRKHKDDPKALNQEMMALYRAHNVNPMMGCLPMLIQMPVLWALFQLLYLKDVFDDATVIGIPWLPLDAKLSLTKVVHNTTMYFFAEIPAHPEYLLVLLIPVLVGGSTWWQQKMSVTDPQQARMFVFMPILLAYFATLYPIGLSIYWIVSTIAYIGEYFLVVGRPHPASVAPPKSQAGRAIAGGGNSASGASGRPSPNQKAAGSPPAADGRGRGTAPGRRAKKGAKRA